MRGPFHIAAPKPACPPADHASHLPDSRYPDRAYRSARHTPTAAALCPQRSQPPPGLVWVEAGQIVVQDSQLQSVPLDRARAAVRLDCVLNDLVVTAILRDLDQTLHVGIAGLQEQPGPYRTTHE